MSDNNKKKSFIEEVTDEIAEELGIDKSKLKADFDEVRKEFREAGVEIKKAAWDTLSDAEKLAARAALKGSEYWEKLDVDDRLYGATAGAKLGALFGLKGGVHGAGIGAVIGAGVGLATGHKAIDRFRQWRDKHKGTEANDNVTDDKPDTTPAASTTPDAKPKSPGEGP